MSEFKLKQTAEEVQRAVDNGLSFGDMPTGGDTLYWDGNTEGLVSGSGIADGEKINAYYKISDAVPTKNDFANGFTFAVKNPLDGTDVNIETSASDAQSSFSDDGFAILADGYFAIIPLGGYIFSFNGLEITCPEPGVYHITPMMASAVANTLTIPGYTGFPVTKKMEEKYLPGAVILYGDPTLATNYLYTTEDYTDSTKRITRTQLLEAVACGRQIYISFDNGDGTGVMFTPVSLQDSIEFVGVACGMAMNDSFMVLTLYTAEYTAS